MSGAGTRGLYRSIALGSFGSSRRGSGVDAVRWGVAGRRAALPTQQDGRESKPCFIDVVYRQVADDCSFHVLFDEDALEATQTNYQS